MGFNPILEQLAWCIKNVIAADADAQCKRALTIAISVVTMIQNPFIVEHLR